MTSSTKPEVHNVLRCRQRRTDPQLQLTHTQYFVKFGHVFLEICKWTSEVYPRRSKIVQCQLRMRDDVTYIVTQKVTATENVNKSILRERIIGFEQ